MSLLPTDYVIPSPSPGGPTIWIRDGHVLCRFSNLTKKESWYDSDGRLHRDGDLPAEIDHRGHMKRWYTHGVLTKVLTFVGLLYHYDKDGKIHREGDLPAVYDESDEDGIKQWYRHGKMYRHQLMGVEKWFDENGKLNREDGPAFTDIDGTQHFYIHGVRQEH